MTQPLDEILRDNLSGVHRGVTRLAGALNDACGILRDYSPEAAVAFLSDMERGGLISIYTGNVATACTAWLLSLNSPSGYLPVEWRNVEALREALAEIVAAHPDKTGQALTKTGLRGWFVIQLAAAEVYGHRRPEIARLVMTMFDEVGHADDR